MAHLESKCCKYYASLRTEYIEYCKYNMIETKIDWLLYKHTTCIPRWNDVETMWCVCIRIWIIVMLIIDIFGKFEMIATKGYWFNVLIYSFLIESATHAQKTWTERR